MIKSYLEWGFDLTQNKVYLFQKSSDLWQLNWGAIALIAECRNTTSSGKQSGKFEPARFVCSMYIMLWCNKKGDDSFFDFHKKRQTWELENLVFWNRRFKRCGSTQKKIAGLDIRNDEFKELCRVDGEDDFFNDRSKIKNMGRYWAQNKKNNNIFV